MPGPIEVASQEFIQQDIINIKTLLYALRGVLVVSFHLTLVLSVDPQMCKNMTYERVDSEISFVRTALKVAMKLRKLTA